MQHQAASTDTPPLRLSRSVVLVGMMGAGKSSIGRRLAARLHIPFTDTDHEIEAAAGASIEQIFEKYGEAEFRKGEKRVIERLLGEPLQVMATGGGAFMDPETRALIQERAISIWLRASVETLLERTSKRQNRPLLKQGNPRDVLQSLMAEREPVYTGADIVIDSDERPTEETVDRVLKALADFMGKNY
jgi:shikimate kinase